MSLLSFYGFILLISLSGIMQPGPLTAFFLVEGKKSPWAGLWITLGHALAEIPLILALFAGLRPFLEAEGLREAISLVGGGVLVYLGRAGLKSARAAPATKAAPSSLYQRGAVAGGVLLTMLNPYWALWWLTVGAGIITRTGEFGWLAGLVGMTILHLLADAVWGVFLTWSANRGHRTLGEGGWRRIEQGCGWVMLGFGVFFLFGGLRGLLA